jgi:hypothetical protein
MKLRGINAVVGPFVQLVAKVVTAHVTKVYGEIWGAAPRFRNIGTIRGWSASRCGQFASGPGWTFWRRTKFILKQKKSDCQVVKVGSCVTDWMELVVTGG